MVTFKLEFSVGHLVISLRPWASHSLFRFLPIVQSGRRKQATYAKKTPIFKKHDYIFCLTSADCLDLWPAKSFVKCIYCWLKTLEIQEVSHLSICPLYVCSKNCICNFEEIFLESALSDSKSELRASSSGDACVRRFCGSLYDIVAHLS